MFDKRGFTWALLSFEQAAASSQRLGWRAETLCLSLEVDGRSDALRWSTAKPAVNNTSSDANEVSVFILSLFVKAEQLQVLVSAHRRITQAHIIQRGFFFPNHLILF